MPRKIKVGLLFLATFLSSLFFKTTLVLASNMNAVTNGLLTTGSQAGFGNSPKSATSLASGTINVVLGMLGIAILLFFVYAGFLYITSFGEPEKIKKAKKILTYTVLGAVVVVAAYALATFALGAVTAIVSS